MKSMPLTIRRCPPEVHEALKKSARANRRSLNAEVLVLLERESAPQPVKGAELAERLRQAEKVLSPEERKAFARDIQRGIKLMRRG
jgi:hypothetical protein